MNPRPPLQSARQNLPFHDSAFGWDTFEDFFCDFLNAQPLIELLQGGSRTRIRVSRARPFGRKGEKQGGIDLLAEMENGEFWDFQCKHCKMWSPQETRKAIAAYERNSSRRFLLVTREVSEECQSAIAEHPNWTLWDAREINRRFRELDPNKAAPILFTHFGPGWAEAFFGISGEGPLMTADAKFERHLRPDIRFHHRHALIGRTPLLQQLDSFIRDEKTRVFIIAGRGGLGKSRLLLHWSREFNQRHPDHTLRFLSEKCTDFAPALRVAPKPLTLAFDDAHRLDDVRRALFHELPRLEGVKLVLSLRPGPTDEVMHELLSVGFDTTEITAAEQMKPLSSEQSMQLVDAALEPEFSQYRHFLRAASRDCPLVAVVGAELINAGLLTSGDLLDENELQRRVFESLLEEAHPVRQSFGQQVTDDFLRLLALLAPVKTDPTFFAKAAPFLNMQHADHASHLSDALDGVGLLHTTAGGTRVTPDLLSDHLAYTACYDRIGQSRTFAERVLGHFSPEEFPKLMQHLAEAEWRALDEIPGAASVVEPLWKWFRERFERSRFHERSSQIHEWANIAHLQPERSLQLAELAVSLKTAPSSANESLASSSWDTHERSLEWLPRMLVGVAEHHPEKVARCLDLLWQLGRDMPADPHGRQEHPITLMGEVVTYKLWKPVEVQTAALDWFERLVSDTDWLHHRHSPGWILDKFFEPIFATSIEESWSTERALHIRAHALHLQKTAPLRDRVLSLCRELLTQRNARLAIQLIQAVGKGCDVARLGFAGTPPQAFIDAWDIERLKCLALLGEISREFTEPLVHFQIRGLLRRNLRYSKDSPVFREACRKLVAMTKESLDLQIARTAFGDCYDEFEEETDDGEMQTAAAGRWATFTQQVAEATHDLYPNAAAWLAHFAELDARWRSFDGFNPNFRHLLLALSERRPSEGISVARVVLATPDHPLAQAFDAIVSGATRGDPTSRLQLIRAAASGAEALQASAVAACTLWRLSEALPEEAWEILESLAPMATPRVAGSIAAFTGYNSKHATLRDWNLVTSLSFTPNDTALAGQIAARGAELVADSKLKPDAASVKRFLSRFEGLSEIEGPQLKNAFAKLADAFPLEMFLTLWKRNQARKAGDTRLKILPYDFARIRFPRITEYPEVKALVCRLEKRLADGDKPDFDEMRLLRSAIQCSDDPSRWLEAAASDAITIERVNLLFELGQMEGRDNPALAYPDFARTLLVQARAIGGDCHDILFQRMLYVGGYRGSTNGEPDPQWKANLAAIERLAERYATDTELGPLFAEIAKRERSWMSSERHTYRFDDET